MKRNEMLWYFYDVYGVHGIFMMLNTISSICTGFFVLVVFGTCSI